MHGSIHLRRQTEPCPHGVRIELDRPEASYRSGEAISGRVHVVARAPEICRSLTLELQAHAHGETNALALVAEQRLFSGNWAPGQSAAYPFSIEAPRTSGAYRGHLFSFELRLAAVFLPGSTVPGKPSLAERLSGISIEEMRARAFPAAVQSVAVARDPRPLVVTVHPSLATRSSLSRAARVWVALVPLVIGLAALAVGAAMALGAIEIDNLAWALLPGAPGAAITIMGAWAFLRSLGGWMAERKVGTPTIAVEQRDHAGQSLLDLSVRVPPAARIDGVAATITVCETIVLDRGESTTEKQHVVAQSSWPLSPRDAQGLFGVGVPMTELAALPPAVGLPGARVEWSLLIRVRLPWWPDWLETLPLDASPGGERTTRSARYRLSFD